MSGLGDMAGLDMLGAASAPAAPTRPISWPGAMLSIAAGGLGAWAWRKHRVLGFLGASALASNVHAVAAQDRTWKNAAERVGRHVVATAGSLALPAHPAVGYVAAAIAADLLIDGKNGGIIEEFAHYAGVKDAAPPVEVVEAIPIETKPRKAVVHA